MRYFKLAYECYQQVWKPYRLSLAGDTTYSVEPVGDGTRVKVCAPNGEMDPQIVLAHFIDRLGQDGKICECNEFGQRIGDWRLFDEAGVVEEPLILGIDIPAPITAATFPMRPAKQADAEPSGMVVEG